MTMSEWGMRSLIRYLFLQLVLKFDTTELWVFCFSASEIQMMTLPPGQFVITDSGVATPVTTGQVKAVTPVSCAAREGFPVHAAVPVSSPPVF